MCNQADVFHLAIPAHNLDEAQQFYVDGLGCTLARRYDDRITLNFFGDQVVCHLSDRIDAAPALYPRHFGVTFRERKSWQSVLNRAHAHDLPLFASPFRRFPGRPEGTTRSSCAIRRTICWNSSTMTIPR